LFDNEMEFDEEGIGIFWLLLIVFV
jgi:hypothetical protein